MGVIPDKVILAIIRKYKAANIITPKPVLKAVNYECL